MIRRLVQAAPLALGLVSTLAFAGNTPPPALAEHVAALRKADAITDPLQRCLAYPDLPGNTWAPGLAQARCRMLRTPPLFSLDALEQALAQPDGAKAVDAKFAALLQAHFTVPEQREHFHVSLGAFLDSDRDKAERVARKWLAASPDSAFAKTALANVLSARGWDARGGKYAQETPEENLRTMGKFFVEATPLFLAALKSNPKVYTACIGLMEMGRQSSPEVQARATKTCLDIDPTSYFVVDELMNAAEPKWGGSDAQMRAVEAFAQAHVKDNPVLALFAYEHLFYAVKESDDEDASALAILEPAAKEVPNAGYMRSIGGAYLRKDDWWKTLVYLSQALRFMPHYATESRFRAYALYRLGEPQWARADAERAVELKPDDGYAQQLLANILSDTQGPDAARPHYELAMREPKLREKAFIAYCATWMMARREQDGLACTDKLVQEYPNNGEAWRMRVAALGPDAPGSAEAMQRFLSTHDPNNRRHAALAGDVRKLLAASEGTATASDAFDARVIRAERLERTEEGRAYLLQFLPQTQRVIQGAINECINVGKAPVNGDDFVAVMDVLPNGTLANVMVSPATERSSCYARRVAERVKAPAPPAKFAEGFPVVIEYGFRARK